jgi:hypothetical protein
MKLKTIAAIAVLALAATLALAACGSDDNDSGNGTTAAGGGYDKGTPARTEETPPPKPAVETIVVRDGAPVGGVAELEYDAGEEVRFRVRSNTADEIHVHGYDVTKEVPVGGTVTVSFPAELEGIYEAELHGSGEQIAEIRVNP